MQFYYGQQMPLRILDEAEFWKMQEQEHTVVIREILKELEPEYVKALQMWDQALSETHQQVLSYVETVIRIQHIPPQLHRDVMQIVHYCLDQSMKFIQLIRQIKVHSAAARDNPVAGTVLDHIIRESEYFIGIARVILYGQPSK